MVKVPRDRVVTGERSVTTRPGGKKCLSDRILLLNVQYQEAVEVKVPRDRVVTGERSVTTRPGGKKCLAIALLLVNVQ